MSLNKFCGTAINDSSTIMGVAGCSKLFGIEIVSAGGGGGGAAPAFGAEIFRASAGFGTVSNDVYTLSTGAAVGQRAVGMFWCATGHTIASIVDSKSNTWNIDKVGADGGSKTPYIASSLISSALVSGDTITVTYDSSFTNWNHMAVVVTVDNTTSLDSTNESSQFGTDVSGSLTTSAATTIVGFCMIENTGSVATVYDGTSAGAIYEPGPSSFRFYVVYKDAASSGSQSTGLTTDVVTNWSELSAAYK